MKRHLLVVLSLGFLLAIPLAIKADTTFLNDTFDGSIVNSGSWHIPTWVSSTDGTYLGHTQMRVTQSSSLPKTSASNALITVESYLPNSAGNAFYGTNVLSNQQVTLGQGVDIKVRAKLNSPVPSGVVGGIFLYALKPGSNTLHDEIDFELVSKHPNEVQTNIYSNEVLGAGHPTFTAFPSGTITDYHTYEIKWLANQVTWYIDGTLIRTETKYVPTGPMNFELNMWVPESGWDEAYNKLLLPANTASANQVFTMSVDSVNITSLTTPPAMPTNPVGTCSADGNTATIAWTLPSGITTALARAYDKTTYGTDTSNACNGKGVCLAVNASSYSFATTPGHTYAWWAHSNNSNGYSDPIGGVITCKVLPPPPTTPVGTCSADGKTATIAWTLPSGVSTVLARAYDTTTYGTDSNNACNGKGVCLAVNASSYSFPATPGHTYGWWAHSNNDSGYSAPIGGSITCKILPPPPTNPVGTCSTDGKTTTLSWTLPSGVTTVLARAYDTTLYSTNTANACNGNGVCLAINASTYSFTSIPGHKYAWWAHSNNTDGYSDPIGGSVICPIPADNPAIQITSATAGASAKGTVSGIDASHFANYNVLVFIKVSGGWWTKPYWDYPTTSIKSDGTWTTAISTGGIDYSATEVRAYIVPTSVAVPKLGGNGTFPTSLDPYKYADVMLK